MQSAVISIFLSSPHEKNIGFTHWLCCREYLLKSLQSIIYILIKQNHFVFAVSSLRQDDHYVQIAREQLLVFILMLITITNGLSCSFLWQLCAQPHLLQYNCSLLPVKRTAELHETTTWVADPCKKLYLSFFFLLILFQLVFIHFLYSIQCFYLTNTKLSLFPILLS